MARSIRRHVLPAPSCCQASYSSAVGQTLSPDTALHAVCTCVFTVREYELGCAAEAASPEAALPEATNLVSTACSLPTVYECGLGCAVEALAPVSSMEQIIQSMQQIKAAVPMTALPQYPRKASATASGTGPAPPAAPAAADASTSVASVPHAISSKLSGFAAAPSEPDQATHALPGDAGAEDSNTPVAASPRKLVGNNLGQAHATQPDLLSHAAPVSQAMPTAEDSHIPALRDALDKPLLTEAMPTDVNGSEASLEKLPTASAEAARAPGDQEIQGQKQGKKQKDSRAQKESKGSKDRDEKKSKGREKEPEKGSRKDSKKERRPSRDKRRRSVSRSRTRSPKR